MDYCNCSAANSNVFVPTQEKGTKEQQDNSNVKRPFERAMKCLSPELCGGATVDPLIHYVTSVIAL